MQIIKMLDTAYNMGNTVISLRNKINSVTGTTYNLITALIQVVTQEEKVIQQRVHYIANLLISHPVPSCIYSTY